MLSSFHSGNRRSFYETMLSHSLLVLFSGVEIRKTGDEYFPFFADRDFVYMTGIFQKQSVLLAVKDGDTVHERLYLLPKDMLAERWTGRRLTNAEAEALSGISDVRPLTAFEADFRALAFSGHFANVYLDLFRYSAEDIEKPTRPFLRRVQAEFPFLTVCNANPGIRALRTIKQDCEIDALRRAEEITKSGILAMMHAARPGIYEYQLKAEFDRALAQFGPDGPGFPSIVSGGRNNFCIHYYAYTGQIQDGDLILNDVGAQYDGHITDVSRSYPCNGRFTGRQKLLYECALATADHMFGMVKPGMRMKDVDAINRSYNAQLLVDAGVLKSVEEIGTLMWHAGAHHIGYDVHDEIQPPEIIQPGMVFCVDVGIYHEDWGIGFRVEDNCLVTEHGCENLSAGIPRTVSDIEAEMQHK